MEQEKHPAVIEFIIGGRNKINNKVTNILFSTNYEKRN